MQKTTILLTAIIMLSYTGCITLKKQISAQSPSWNKLENLNIIPCPKIVRKNKTQKVSFSETPVIIIQAENLKTRLAANLVADNIVKLTSVKPTISFQGARLKNNLISIIEFKDKLPADIDSKLLGKQGYHLSISNSLITLSANDPQGHINGAATLNQILAKDTSGTIMVPKMEIIDWPDFKNRCATSLRIKTLSQGKELVDWLVKYKYNWVMTSNRPDNTLPEEWPILRIVNEYAKVRGVKFIYCGSWAIGDKKYDGAKADFQGCICFQGNYYCWSRDALIRDAAQKYVNFINATKPAMVNFHCLDSENENWPERCSHCRKRFGDERASADANVINIFYNQIKKQCNDVRLGFVTQPYGIDLSLPGNQEYRVFYEQLSRKIPDVVALNQTGYNKDAHSMISKVVKQPIIRWQNGSSFQSGRFFDTEPRLFKGLYYPERKNDIAYINELYGDFRDGNVMLLTGIEYMWNTEAPGASVWESNKTCPVEKIGPYDYQKGLVDGKTVWGHPSDGSQTTSDELNIVLDPPETSEILLKRICISLYGKQLAPYMYNFYRIGIVGWWAPHRALKFISNDNSAKSEYLKCKKAEKILLSALSSTTSNDDKSIIKRFLKRIILLGQFYKISAGLKSAQYAVNKGLDSPDTFRDINQQIKNAKKIVNSHGISIRKVDFWFIYPQKQLQVIEAEKRLKAQIKNQKKQVGLKVAIYYPNFNGGCVVGAKTILKLLSSKSNIAPVFIDNLKEAELNKYNVLIIPHLKRFGNGDEKIYHQSIQDYTRNGGGVYFEHDSVGFYRGVIKNSLFPLICKNAFRRKEYHYVMTTGNHSCLDGISPKVKHKHLYWDHIALTPGAQGTILLKDQDAHAVAIAGLVGKGRVLFSGMITYPSEKDPSANPAEHIDKKFLLNSIYWLAGIDAKNTHNSYPQKVYDFSNNLIKLQLSPEEKYSIWMSPSFKLKPNKGYLINFTLKKNNFYRFLPFIAYKKKSGTLEEIQVITNFPSCNVMTDFQRFSGVFSVPEDAKVQIKLFFDWYKYKPQNNASAEIKNISIYELESDE